MQDTKLFFSLKLTSDYYRHHASSTLNTIYSFFLAEKIILIRIFRLGWSQHIKLTRLELGCAQSGLSFKNINKLTPPWVLLDDFLTRRITDLPAHPLIETPFLAKYVDQNSGAYAALIQLLQPDGLKLRWKQTPIIDLSTPINNNARIAVCLHLFYPDLWPILQNSLQLIPEPYDIYITIPDFACTRKLELIANEQSNAYFIPCTNRGRDVLPFIRLLNQRIFDGYDVVCKIHSKKSLHISSGDQWLTQILGSLLGNKDKISTIINKFRTQPDIGLIGPKEQLIERGHPAHGSCKHLQRLFDRFFIGKEYCDRPFFAGTMFWFRPAAFNGFKNLKLTTNDLPLEMGQRHSACRFSPRLSFICFHLNQVMCGTVCRRLSRNS